jgi:hypothetical protein
VARRGGKCLRAFGIGGGVEVHASLAVFFCAGQRTRGTGERCQQKLGLEAGNEAGLRFLFGAGFANFATVAIVTLWNFMKGGEMSDLHSGCARLWIPFRLSPFGALFWNLTPGACLGRGLAPAWARN